MKIIMNRKEMKLLASREKYVRDVMKQNFIDGY